MQPEPENRQAPSSPSPAGHDGYIADAPASNWVDRVAPDAVKPYLRLMRLDRPIGIWLLLWPCWWSVVLASTHTQQASSSILVLLAAFALGAVIMRGAGCTYNDIVDREIDAQVARTRARPLASGAISLRHAFVFLVVQLLLGFCILLSFNNFTIWLAIASLALVGIYPFMKRITYWPQLFLGLAFSFGALLGWSALKASLGIPAIILYLGSIFWVIGYDTIYAHQDKEDDALLGMKSTALKFGTASKTWLSLFYTMAFLLFVLSGWYAQVGYGYYAGLVPLAAHFIWQIQRLDIHDPQRCLVLFRSNREAGALLFLAFVLGMVTI